MDRVAPLQRIASAFVVFFGAWGAVKRHAAEREVCRQRLYREAKEVRDDLTFLRADQQRLQGQVEQLQRDNAVLQARLQTQTAMTVVLDAAKQGELACLGQAMGVSLEVCHCWLDALIPGQALSRPTLGRMTQTAGKHAGELLQVLDATAAPRIRAAAADEIYVKQPVLMMADPESLYWCCGWLSKEVSGEAWAAPMAALPQLEQLVRDGGSGMAKGLERVNTQRRAAGLPEVVDQGDHFHLLRCGCLGLRRVRARAEKTFAKAEALQAGVDAKRRQGYSVLRFIHTARAAWRHAEKAMDQWIVCERAWRRVVEALRLITPEGQWNTRGRAEAVLAEALASLPDDFDQLKRQLAKPEMLAYLDQAQQRLAAVPFPEELTQAAMRQVAAERRPEPAQRESVSGAAMRGVLLLSALVLSRAGAAGEQALAAVRTIAHRAYRASSLIECLNSVLRMQQSRHRRMTQGLLDLKRLYWNSHRFRTGRRRGTSPLERLGIPWPPHLRFPTLLSMTPEQLRNQLSAPKTAA